MNENEPRCFPHTAGPVEWAAFRATLGIKDTQVAWAERPAKVLGWVLRRLARIVFRCKPPGISAIFFVANC